MSLDVTTQTFDEVLLCFINKVLQDLGLEWYNEVVAKV